MKRVVGLLLLATLASAFAQDDPHDPTRDLLDEGVKLYKQGKLDQAYAAFEKAMQQKPSHELVYAWLRRTGEDIIFSMLNSTDRKVQDMGRRLLSHAQPVVNFKVEVPTIKKMIDDLASEDYQVQVHAHYHLVNYGPYAVSWLIPHLNNAAADRLRSRVMLVLKEIGTAATMAVVECLESDREKNKLMRQCAATVLGNIGDERAIPALKRLYEDPNEYPEVKKEAHIALSKLTKKGSDKEWLKATDYYYHLAEKFYYSHPDVIRAWERSFLYWKWDKEKNQLTERYVPQFAYNEQLAEEQLMDLLELDPNYEKAWPLLAMTLLAQHVEAEAALEAARQGALMEEVTQQELDDLLMRMNKVERVNVLAEMIGVKYVYQALERAMKDGNPLVARAAIDIIKEKGTLDDLAPYEGTGVQQNGGSEQARESFIGYPLARALTYEDKRVRYAAAEAMLKIAPRTKKLGADLVIPNLSDALGEMGVRVALVIYDVKTEQDYQVVNNLRKALLAINVFPVIAKSAGEGLIKARDFPTEDIILIQYKLAGVVYIREAVHKKLVEESVFDTLRDDVRTRNIPRVIIADTEEEKARAEEIFKQHIVRVILPTVDRLDLEKTFLDVFSYEKADRDAKARADELAKRAAEALASLDPETTVYPYNDAVPSLIKAASPEIRRQQFIRIPAIRALGHFGDTRAVDVLVKIVDDRPSGEEDLKREKPVRWEAAKALSQVWKKNRYTPSDEMIEVLKKHLHDGDYDIELGVGEALGNANIDNKKRYALEVFRRLNRHGLTAEEIEAGKKQ